MSQHAGLSPEYLSTIPLTRGLNGAELAKLAELFIPVPARPGDTLFESGTPAEALYLLQAGEATLHRASEEDQRLVGPTLIGELGALTALKRISTVVVGEDAVLWKVSGVVLREFFAQHQDFGLRLYHDLLEVVADKILRDQLRLADMRQNLIRTQKAMKEARNFLLESQDTVVSERLHEILEGQIKRNRRVNYRVEPPAALAATVALDDDRQASVVQISATHVSYHLGSAGLPAAGDRISGVLSLCGPELPFSGEVLRTINGRVDVELDLLIDEYVEQLEGYLTRVQMLDLLV